MNTPQRKDQVAKLINGNQKEALTAQNLAEVKSFKKEALQVVNSPIEKLEEKTNEPVAVKPKKPRTPRVKKVVVPTPEPIKVEEIKPKVEDFSTGKVLMLALKGLVSLYQNKLSVFTSSGAFIYKNLNTLFTFLLNIAGPLTLTYITLNYIPFIANIVSQTEFPMLAVQYAVFFIISSVFWVTAWIMLEGIVDSLKQSVKNLAKIGLDN